ncbi:hypothetical protein BU198_07630, partial [Streptomyces sp. CBMA156]|nr:hypothetical protein [Streptomyces sp. CBMA156]
APVAPAAPAAPAAPVPAAPVPAVMVAPTRPDTSEAAPTVAVDRLFRDDPVPAEGQARARTPRRRASADDLFTEDTVRLRRPVSGAAAACPSAARTPALPAAPAAPATPDDHRSE